VFSCPQLPSSPEACRTAKPEPLSVTIKMPVKWLTSTHNVQLSIRDLLGGQTTHQDGCTEGKTATSHTPVVKHPVNNPLGRAKLRQKRSFFHLHYSSLLSLSVKGLQQPPTQTKRCVLNTLYYGILVVCGINDRYFSDAEA